jgi:hypothetical protein
MTNNERLTMTYWQQLQDPRWQRKRLEIFQRANFQCDQCGETLETLHIHHRYYQKGLMAWEYPNASLLCLCETCHPQVAGFEQAFLCEVDPHESGLLLDFAALLRRLKADDHGLSFCLDAIAAKEMEAYVDVE